MACSGVKVHTPVIFKSKAAHDLINHKFVAERPEQLWVADFTYVSTWQGFAYVAFIIDVFAGVIAGRRGAPWMETAFVLDALEQALWSRRSTGATLKACSTCRWRTHSGCKNQSCWP